MDFLGTIRSDERIDITPQGRYDLLSVATCDCRPKMLGVLLQCPSCGTVYGHEAEMPWYSAYNTRRAFHARRR